MKLITNKALAYVYSGEWVADCPRGCGNVEYLSGDNFHCSYCRMVSPVHWPGNRQGIEDILSRRPVPHTRNWYPEDHPVAVRHGIPHGQSLDDLREENAEHGVV